MSTAAFERLAAALADRYRLERELGAGGMATVYLAADLKHDRKVAIKVLKPELAAVLGAERFVVEIKTTAAMSHPHILPLFDSGTADGFLFYVMPYIQGETIREKLNRETQFGVDEAVRIAREIADALDYAHRAGVIHRDIKPENILLHDGRAMVMDFGIALAVSAAAGGRMTETGLSLGTPHYMSPEQATAEKEITGRSDQYSLASVLYEMLAGDPPFVASAAQAVIMKIITETAPPVTTRRKNVPANVTAALAKALEKLPADRFDSAKAFADALSNLAFSAGTSARTGAADPSARRKALLPWIGTVAFAAVSLALLFRPATRASDRTPLTAVVELPPGVTPDFGSPWGALSPDGRTLVFRGLGATGAQLYTRDLATGLIDTLPGTLGASAPIWSLDGERLAFVRGRRLWIGSKSGVGAAQVCDHEFDDQSSGSWGPDGRLLISDAEAHLVVAEPGVGCQRLDLPPGRWRRPHIAPDGRTAIIVGGTPGGQRLFDLHLRSLDLREVGVGAEGYPTDAGSLIVALPDGQRVTIGAMPYDFRGRRPLGELRIVATDGGSTYNGPSVAVVGDRIVYPRAGWTEGRTRLYFVRDGAVVDSITQSFPSGFLLAAARRSPWLIVAGSRIEFVDVKDRTSRRLSEGFWQGVAIGPGDSLFAAKPSGGACSVEIRSTLTGALRRTIPGAESDGACLAPRQWTPSGQHLLSARAGFGVGDDLWLIDIASGNAERVVDEPSPVSFGAVSPSGRWIAYVVNATVVVRPFGREGQARVVSEGYNAIRPLWHPTLDRVYFAAAPSGIHSVDITPDGGPVTRPSKVFDGAWYMGLVYATSSNLFQVLADGRTLAVRGIDHGTGPRDAFVVIDGWSRLLDAATPQGDGTARR